MQIKFKAFSINLKDYQADFKGLTVPGKIEFGNKTMLNAEKFTIKLDKEHFNKTKEVVFDFINTPALNRYEYVSNSITAQSGNATSGSEDRKIPISGDSPYPTEKKLYVELRRASIARSGNHTF